MQSSSLFYSYYDNIYEIGVQKINLINTSQGPNSHGFPLQPREDTILERSLARPKTEVSLSVFARLFSEIVQYCRNRVYSVSELQAQLSKLGQQVRCCILDPLVTREKNGKREVISALLFIKVVAWKALFGKEADKLEQADNDNRTFYIIEKDPHINSYISVPKENSTFNCTSFTAGIAESLQRLLGKSHGSLEQRDHPDEQIDKVLDRR